MVKAVKQSWKWRWLRFFGCVSIYIMFKGCTVCRYQTKLVGVVRLGSDGCLAKFV